MSGNAVTAIRTWSPAVLGIGTPGQIVVKTDTDATFVGGEEGVIYIENDLVEAIGICARGGRDDNMDAIGVQERDDGSLLFHLADGMGGRPDGEQAAELAIEGMSYFVGMNDVSFEDTYDHIIRSMAFNKLHPAAGTTYVGLFIDQRNLPLTAGFIGDSQLGQFATERGGRIYTSPPHSMVYRDARRLDEDRLVTALKHWGQKDIKEFFIKMRLWHWKKRRSAIRKENLRILRLLYQYAAPYRSIITRFIAQDKPHQIDTCELERGTGDQYLYAIYTDGLGGLFTPIDIAAEFTGNGMPLYEQGLRFGQKVMLAQENGREADVGGRKKLRIEGIEDNYACWFIRLKR